MSLLGSVLAAYAIERLRFRGSRSRSVFIASNRICRAASGSGMSSGTITRRSPSAFSAAWKLPSFGCQRVLNCYSYTGGFSVAALAGAPPPQSARRDGRSPPRRS